MGRRSTVRALSLADQAFVEALVVEGRATMEGVVAAAAARGIKLSRSAVHRFARRFWANQQLDALDVAARAERLSRLSGVAAVRAEKPRIRVQAPGCPRPRIRVKAIFQRVGDA